MQRSNSESLFINNYTTTFKSISLPNNFTPVDEINLRYLT